MSIEAVILVFQDADDPESPYVKWSMTPAVARRRAEIILDTLDRSERGEGHFAEMTSLSILTWGKAGA